jgi:hypothetical protein
LREDKDRWLFTLTQKENAGWRRYTVLSCDISRSWGNREKPSYGINRKGASILPSMRFSFTAIKGGGEGEAKGRRNNPLPNPKIPEM